MEKRRELREDIMVDLSFVYKKKEHAVQTTNLSRHGCSLELKSNVRPPNGQLLQLAGEFKSSKLHFTAMVKWYQRELHRNLLGLQIINPPAEWDLQISQAQASTVPVFQLHFGNALSLEQEYKAHLSHGFLEVSPTPKVPSINASVIIDVFLPGLPMPERISGRVEKHTPGGFNVRLNKQSVFLRKVEQALS